jgi:hypothetical protein
MLVYQRVIAPTPKKHTASHDLRETLQETMDISNTLWLFNVAMETMAHRNRWFTY